MHNFKYSHFKLLVIIFTLVISVFGVPSAAAKNDTELPSAGVNRKFIVKLNQADSAVLQRLGATNIDKKFSHSVEAKFEGVYGFESTLSLAELNRRLVGQIEYLEFDNDMIAAVDEVSVLPDDPGFTTNKANIDRQWGLAKAQFIDAWKQSVGSTRAIVAIVDTGIDATHEDLQDANVIKGYNVKTGQPIHGGQNSDDNGHGTLVAGVVGAATNNDTGIAGAVWKVSLMPVKALNAQGKGTASEISEAIVWAADNGANVINLSLGGIGFAHEMTLANAISHAFSKNVIIVSAAGNDVAVTGGNLDVEPVFPICNDNGKNMIIGVTATDVNDLKPEFANFGKACVDVSAPGKRILSTINHDPATGVYSPDSYAYASGTSLAVPHVSAQAALIKSLFPFASNRQIRDRIIATADSIDKLNLSQCAGKSCSGFLGSGRINVAKSIEEQISRIPDGSVVRVAGTEELYYINGGKRQPVTPFVYNQRFLQVVPTEVSRQELENYSEGSFAEPLDGTLVKIPNDNTVYYMSKGLRLPVTYLVFTMRGLKFSEVLTLSNTEVNSWIVGSFLTPPEGTLVRTPGNQTVYWTIGSALHPINHSFWVNRGLNIFPVIFIDEGELSKYPQGESLIL